MSDDSDNNPESPERRDFLGKATMVIAGTGAAVASLPFISSMNPTADVISKATAEVDLTEIPEGGIKTVAWQGKPVFVMHRTQEQIRTMQESMGGKDPEPDEQRVQRPEWLVVLGVCTHLGCVPNRKEQGWFCPCHGSEYDDSGRILSGPAPTNLEMPVYRFVSDNSILIGKV